jgi:hypothetical protein
MSNKDSISTKKISKKEARKLVYEKLAVALAEFKETVKEKKFVSNLKKASKLFAADIAKTIGSKAKAQKVKKPSKKELKVIPVDLQAQKTM